MKKLLLFSVPLGKLSHDSNAITVRDKTEEMIPREVEWHRQQMQVVRIHFEYNFCL